MVVHVINIVSAVAWSLGMAAMAINYSMGEPVTLAGRYLAAMALLYVNISLFMRALDSLDRLVLMRDQHLDRRPKSGRY